MKNQFFRAAKSALSNAVSAPISPATTLFQRSTALISPETDLNTGDFLWIQDDILQFNFQFFSKYFEVSQLRDTKF